MTAAVINPEAAGRNAWTAPALAFAAIAGTCAVLFHPTAWSMVELWAFSSSYHHGFVVAPAAVWMIAAMSARPQTPGGRLPGLAIFVLGLFAWLAGRAGTVAIIEHVAFVTLMIGAAGIAFGANALRAWAYPLAFLYFLVPFGTALTPVLQQITAQTVVGLLSAVGTPVALEGILITTPAGAFEVAEACAGLRFLIAALMIAAVFAYASFTSWRKRILFLLFAIVVALAANGLRAFLMVLIATLTQMRWGVGPDHWLIGWAFYAAVFAVLILIGRRYADRRAPIEVAAGGPGRSGLASVFIAIGLTIAAALYAGLVVERTAPRTAPASLSLLSAPGWRILPPPENWRAHIPQADRTAAATYAAQDRSVYIALGFFTHDRRGGEIVAHDNRAWDGEDWRRIGTTRAVVYVFGRSEETAFDLLAGADGRRLAAVTAYWHDGEIYLSPRRAKMAQIKDKLVGRHRPGGMVVIAAAYRRDPAEAIAAIRSYTVAVEPLKAWLARNGG